MKHFIFTKLLPVIGVILFFTFGLLFNDRNNKKISNKIFDREVTNSKIEKIDGYSNAIIVVLEDGEEITFAPKFNKKLNCQFKKCVNVGDTIFKQKKSKLIKVVKKSVSDTLVFEVY